MTGRGVSEQLSPDAVEVLLRLADSPGSLVTREALLEKVWGAGNGDGDVCGAGREWQGVGLGERQGCIHSGMVSRAAN